MEECTPEDILHAVDGLNRSALPEARLPYPGGAVRAFAHTPPLEAGECLLCELPACACNLPYFSVHFIP